MSGGGFGKSISAQVMLSKGRTYPGMSFQPFNSKSDRDLRLWIWAQLLCGFIAYLVCSNQIMWTVKLYSFSMAYGERCISCVVVEPPSLPSSPSRCHCMYAQCYRNDIFRGKGGPREWVLWPKGLEVKDVNKDGLRDKKKAGWEGKGVRPTAQS